MKSRIYGAKVIGTVFSLKSISVVGDFCDNTPKEWTSLLLGPNT